MPQPCDGILLLASIMSQLAGWLSRRTRDKGNIQILHTTSATRQERSPARREKETTGWSSMSACQLSLSPKEAMQGQAWGAPPAGRAPSQTRAPHVLGVGPCLGASGKPILT